MLAIGADPFQNAGVMRTNTTQHHKIEAAIQRGDIVPGMLCAAEFLTRADIAFARRHGLTDEEMLGYKQEMDRQATLERDYDILQTLEAEYQAKLRGENQ